MQKFERYLWISQKFDVKKIGSALCGMFFFLLLFPFLFGDTVGTNVEASETIKTDLMYVIDVSGSMIGLPKSSGAEDIFPEVIKAIERDIERIEIGTRAFVLTFAEGPHDVDGSNKHYQSLWEKEVKSTSDREKVRRYIRGLDRAMRDTSRGHGCGWRTAIYDAMKVALERFDRLRETHNRTHLDRYRDSHIQRIVLLTDGKDNVSKEWDFKIFLREFKLRRAEDRMGDHIFIRIVPLRRQLFSKKEKNEINRTRGISIASDPGNPNKEISPLRKLTFSITPSKFSFRGLAKGTTKSKEFIVKAENLTKAKTLNVAVEGIDRELFAATLDPSVIVLRSDRPSASIMLAAKAKRNLSWWRSLEAKILVQDPSGTVALATVTLRGKIPWKLMTLITLVMIGVIAALIGFHLRRRLIPLRISPANSRSEKRLSRTFELKPGDEVEIGKTNTGYTIAGVSSFFKAKRQGRKVSIEPAPRLFDAKGDKIEAPFFLKGEATLQFGDKKIKLARQSNV